jgi:peptidoglycan/LPS O-acetylase OafA/YrhL
MTSMDPPITAADASASVGATPAPAGREGPPIGGRILELDGLRGLAIASVVVWHYVAITTRAPHHSPVSLGVASLSLTWSGVDLFFVLSGFLIGGVLLDARGSSRFFGPFYRRRFFRIVPLYAVVCAIFGIGWLMGGAGHGAIGAWFFGHPPPWYAFPLFLSNVFVGMRGTFDPLPIGVTWSLGVEEQFYLTLPLLVRYLPQRRLLPVLLAIVASVPILRTAAFFSSPGGGLLAYTAMPCRADALVFGVIVAVLVRRPEAWSAMVARRPTLKRIAMALLVGLTVVVLFHWTTQQSVVMATVGYTWVAAFYAVVLVLALTGRQGRLAGALRQRRLRSLGAIAYGTYLLHVGVQGACFWVLFGREPRIATLAEAGVTVLAAALSIALAQASWTLFESRMIQIGRRSSAQPAAELEPGSVAVAADGAAV